EVFEIDVRAANGTVFLEGKVNTLFERQQAEKAAEKVIGVIDVVNLIEYEMETAEKSDMELKHDINSNLYWSPFVNQDEIKVEVDDGVVTLTGTVYFWNERVAAEDNAFQAGAKDVINRIETRALKE
ncbi:MAG: BON domain-containing protein, partial [candidate division Zixibacteria bacterium]|nr:BON domain-containing protein [candidate division Zixibacteria bacterium]